MNLQIHCPACNRRFRVHDDLTGKTVECGACDHRFLVSAETIVAEKERFYPGEHHDGMLDRFGRSPVREDVPVNFKTAAYDPQASADSVLPSTPAQTFASIVGVSLIVLFGVFFTLTSGEGQLFQDVTLVQRLTLGGFVAVVGSLLLIVGAKTWRNRGVLLATVLSAVLLALIYIRPVHITPRSGGMADAKGAQGNGAAASDPEESPLSDEDKYLKHIGYGSVEKKFEEAADPANGINGKDSVIAIYVHPFKESDLIALEQFFTRVLKLAPTEAMIAYTRDGGNARLLVLTEVKVPFGRIADFCESLGKVKTLPDRRVIDLTLSQAVFAEPSPEQNKRLTDVESEYFCSANLDELGHINLNRVTKAVQRLGSVPDDKLLRHKPEIVASLLNLLKKENDEDLMSEIGLTLQIWAKDDAVVADEVGQEILGWFEEGSKIPVSLVDYLTASGVDSALAIVDGLWAVDPSRWSEQYEALGKSGESRLVYHLKSSPIQVKKAAAAMLRKVGTQESVPALQATMGVIDDEMDILIVRALEMIKSR
ncbi:MAG: MJ0042-type zinc finger domain-containing protein [Verrucomicrobiaceae bacterium]